MKKQSWNVITLKEYFERIILDRVSYVEKMIQVGDASAQARLLSQKEAVTAALTAADKAIEKSEIAQKEYNIRSNEFRAALDDAAKLLLTRTEASVQFNQLRDLHQSNSNAIQELQKVESRTEGGTKALEMSKNQQQWLISLTIGLAVSIFTAIGSLIFFLVQRKG